MAVATKCLFVFGQGLRLSGATAETSSTNDSTGSNLHLCCILPVEVVTGRVVARGGGLSPEGFLLGHYSDIMHCRLGPFGRVGHRPCLGLRGPSIPVAILCCNRGRTCITVLQNSLIGVQPWQWRARTATPATPVVSQPRFCIMAVQGSVLAFLGKIQVTTLKKLTGFGNNE